MYRYSLTHHQYFSSYFSPYARSPILAIPLNLSILLALPQGLAYAGFTGSTGLKWEKHDILSWTWH